MLTTLKVNVERFDEVTTDDICSVDELTQMQCDGLENLAGYVAFKLRKKETVGFIPDSSDCSFSWINHVSEGGLMKPTNSFLENCRQLNAIYGSNKWKFSSNSN